MVLVLSAQVLFPYDEFMDLFDWDMLKDPPCGLINCGNRYIYTYQSVFSIYHVFPHSCNFMNLDL